ncbi:Uncharacterised protein [uncultured archaeon]|nr:Uncharacterised protein [uncultured archaeon]
MAAVVTKDPNIQTRTAIKETEPPEIIQPPASKSVLRTRDSTDALSRSLGSINRATGTLGAQMKTTAVRFMSAAAGKITGTK